MTKLIRARHEVFGVCEVPDTDWYLGNGWTEVDPATPTADEERLAKSNAAAAEATAYDPADATVEDVTAYLAVADDEERKRVIRAERSGKARKGVLDWQPEPAAE